MEAHEQLEVVGSAQWIANGIARQACSLTTKFPTQQQASRYLRQNWNRIEQMARDCLARECFEDGRINLVMI
jgi:hypothetical protein